MFWSLCSCVAPFGPEPGSEKPPVVTRVLSLCPQAKPAKPFCCTCLFFFSSFYSENFQVYRRTNVTYTKHLYDCHLDSAGGAMISDMRIKNYKILTVGLLQDRLVPQGLIPWKKLMHSQMPSAYRNKARVERPWALVCWKSI